ncbi:hypothetical protein FRC01_001509 [Tulasnella sp. 417]|nr:hypothetical protein FRC01_001509 [Tulasnella sp. 417]
MREGMWERTHKAEMEEQQRRKERARERKEKEKRLKEESKRLEAEAIEEHQRKRQEKDRRKLRDSWMAYESRWSTLQKAAGSSTIVAVLTWPVHPPPKSIDDLTKDSISAFVLSDLHSAEKTKKQRLRDALLLYHPDRFEGKFMAFVRDQDRAQVTEGVGRVVRALNALTEEGG